MNKLFRILTLALVLLLGFTSPLASAATSQGFRALELDAPWYDPDSGNGCSVTGGTVPNTIGGALGSDSSVYILGDSITVGAKEAYTSSFSEKDIDAFINGSTSRSIKGKGQDGDKLSGLEAVGQDKDTIAVAKAIVIALGTNGGNSSQTIGELYSAIREYNSSAPVYWLDTTVIDKASYLPTIRDANRAIYNNQALGYRVISWFKAVTPSGDPQNPSGSETDSLGLVNVSDDYHVHLTGAGTAAIAKLVVDNLTGVATPNIDTGATCFGGTPSTVPGNTNEEKAWNFLILHGLTPIQAAGMMGNLQSEAHFEPRLVQYTHRNCRGEVSEAGKPSSLCDYIVVDGDTGYGLAQWTTSGRQQALHEFAAGRKTIDGNIDTQLEFLWLELNTTFKNSVLGPLRNTNDLTIATDIVLKKFECPRPCVNIIKDPSNKSYQEAYQTTLNDRKAFALGILTKFGSNGGQ